VRRQTNSDVLKKENVQLSIKHFMPNTPEEKQKEGEMVRANDQAMQPIHKSDEVVSQPQAEFHPKKTKPLRFEATQICSEKMTKTQNDELLRNLEE
jgi:hypothetical protein